ncbi:Bcr/CflA family drug resistance efflux transporter, partial [Marinomonas sp. 42_23_T18]
MASVVEVLWFSRVLQGLGACAISVCVISGVRDSYSLAKASRIYSYLNGVICVIPALAPMLGGMLLAWWGWQSGFILMYAYAVIMAFVVILKLPETLPENTIKQKKLFSLARYKPILVNPKFRFHTGMVMLFMAIIIGYISMVSVQLMVVMKQSTFAFSLWFGANALVNIITSFSAPKIIDRIGRKQAIQISSLMALFAGVGLLMVQNSVEPLALMIPVFISSTGVGFVFAVSNAGALAPFGERAGTASALLGFFQMTGAAVIVALINVLPFTAMANFALVMCLPIIWLAFHSFSDQALFKLEETS